MIYLTTYSIITIANCCLLIGASLCKASDYATEALSTANI